MLGFEWGWPVGAECGVEKITRVLLGLGGMGRLSLALELMEWEDEERLEWHWGSQQSKQYHEHSLRASRSQWTVQGNLSDTTHRNCHTGQPASARCMSLVQILQGYFGERGPGLQ